MKKKASVLWVDLEMTGLEVERDRILEVAAIGTDWEFNEIVRMEGVVKVPEELMKERMVGEFWEKNAKARDGLMKQNKKGISTEEMDEKLRKWIDESFVESAITTDPTYQGKIILAGNSVYNDKKFIEKEWPLVSERLHYRMLDVSAWKVVFQARNKFFTKKEEHRAMDDILGSISELKYYMEKIK
ncbi:MAG: oligoribonuclease [Candidatus Saccharibacteria bacterium]|nr:oligoribonuclease [Candidatus Saccharibacteria bacterium]